MPAPKDKLKAAVELGRRGGNARAKSLTPEQLREISRKGNAARWKGHKKRTRKASTDASAEASASASKPS